MGFCSNLGDHWLFSSPAGFYWVHIDWPAPGHPMGAGNPTISRETETQVPAACQPQPRQPHIIKLIAQLQKPTRKITDTWIIDTGKRETRYQLVKVHQTIRQPHKSWAPKNWCFWTVVLEKTLESPMDCKEIKPVNPEGNLSWIFIGRTDTEAEAPTLWPPDVKKWLTGTDPGAGKEWRREEKGTMEDEMVGWHHRLDGHEFD